MRTPTILSILALATCSSLLLAEDSADLRDEVRQREQSFAQSMADRDHTAFVAHLAAEAVFFGRQVLRGKDAVADGWAPLFAAPEAPFSWRPEEVEVLETGTLGMTSGPVFSPSGERVGTFNSIWRREADGVWRIVFDKGCPPCDCGGEASPPGESEESR